MQATRKQKANASWCIIALIALIKHHLQTHAGSRLPCCNVWFDVWLLQNPNRKRGHDCPNWRMRCSCACRPRGDHSECMLRNATNPMKILPVMRATREILWDLCHVSTKWQYVTIMTSTTIVQFFKFHDPNWKASRAAAVSSSWSCWPRRNVSLGRNGRPTADWKALAFAIITQPDEVHLKPWDKQKWKVEFFSPNIHLLKTTWCMRRFYQMPLMPTWESCPPENLKSDLPVAAELVISPHREIHPGFCAGSVIMAQKKCAGWKKNPHKENVRHCHVPMFPWRPMGLYLCTNPEPRDLFWILQVFVLPEHLVASYSSIRTMFVWKCCVIVHKLYGSIWQLGLPWRLSLSFAIWRGKHLFASPTMLCSCLVLSSLRSCRSAPLFPSNTTPTTAAHRIVFAPHRSEKTPSSSLNWRQIKCLKFYIADRTSVQFHAE